MSLPLTSKALGQVPAMVQKALAPSRNCPKSLGRAHGGALRESETVLFGPFRAPYPAKYGVGALLVTLFGQFL